MAVTACHDIFAPAKESTLKPELRRNYTYDGMMPVYAGDSVVVQRLAVFCEPDYWWDGTSNVGASIDIAGPVSGSFSDTCNNLNPYVQTLRFKATTDGVMTMTMTDPRYGTGPLCVRTTDPSYDALCRIYQGGGGVWDEAQMSVHVWQPDPPTDSLTLTCDKTTLTRGSPISCTAALTSGQPLTNILSWSFTPSDTAISFLPRYRKGTTPTSTTWSGPIVTSGDINVSTLDGKNAVWTVQVQSRNWGQAQLPVIDVQDLGAGPVPGRRFAFFDPPLDGILGETTGRIDTLNLQTTVPNNFTMISGGPNDSLSYSTSVPGPIRIRTSVHYPSLKAGSLYWSYQDSLGVAPMSAGFCNRQFVVDLLPLVRKHEGVDPYVYSHVNTLQTGYAQGWVPAIEALVRVGYPNSADLTSLAEIQDAYAGVISNNITEDKDNDPAYHVCTLRRSPP